MFAPPCWRPLQLPKKRDQQKRVSPARDTKIVNASIGQAYKGHVTFERRRPASPGEDSGDSGPGEDPGSSASREQDVGAGLRVWNSAVLLVQVFVSWFIWAGVFLSLVATPLSVVIAANYFVSLASKAFAKAPMMELLSFWIMGLLIWWLPSSRLMPQNSKRALNQVLARLPDWLQPQLASAINLLMKRSITACLRFLAVNIMVAAIPGAGFSIKVHTPLMEFLDLNHDGVISATEFTEWFLKTSRRIFVAATFLYTGLFLLDIKASPREKVPSSKFGDGQLKRVVATFFREKQAKGAFAKGRLVLVDRLLTTAIWLLIIYPWLDVFGVSVKTVLALGGVGGFAFGLASKNVVGNAIAGVLIYLNRTLSEGDEIDSRAKNIRGIVDNIGLTTTQVNQLNGMPMTVPNSILLEEAVTNRTTKFFLKVEETFHVMLPDVRQLRGVIAQASRPAWGGISLYMI